LSEVATALNIERFRTRVVALPTEGGPLTGIAASTFVVLQLWTDDGIEGIGYGTLVPQVMVNPLKVTVDALAEQVIGQDAMGVEKITDGLLAMAANGNVSGLLCHAVAAIDIALWDIRGKSLGQPVHRLLGSLTDRVPVYASGYFWRDYPLDRIAKNGPELVSEGFTAMKLRVGAEDTPAKEVERVRVLREAVGDDIDIMIDVNQGWDVNQAITIGKMLEEYGIYWLEDPIAHDDFMGQAQVAAALDVPIASGEYHYGISPFRYLLEHRSLDIAMIDLMRAPGMSRWMKAAHIAEGANFPVVSHLAPEFLCHAMAAIPNGLITEHMPWGFPLFQEPPTIENGDLVLPQSPGFGLDLDETTVNRYTVG